MAYDITSKTSPLNVEYEDSKNMTDAVNIAAQHSLQRERIKAAQPNKYTQTLQAINATLQTVNSGLQVAENVNTIYDQITTKSFKRDQLEKQNRLKEEIQGAINDNDWNKVATLAMSNMSVASQMPEYMDALGRMAKISGNEGSAALLRSVNTEQQGKLELEEVKNLGKLQVAQERNKGTIAAANIRGQWGYKTGLAREQLKQNYETARLNQTQQFNAQRTAFLEEGRERRSARNAEVKLKTANQKKGKPTDKFGQQPTNESVPLDGNGGRMGGVNAELPSNYINQGDTTEADYSYIDNFKNSFTIPLTTKDQNAKIADKQQAIADAGRAPSKEEQEKANANKQRSQLAEQETKEFAASFENDELNSVMLNFPEIKGTDGASKLTYALNNPDEYEFKHVTEPSAVTKIINGKDNNLSINNLSDKYKDVVQVTQIRDKKTGQVQNLYLKSDQAKKLNDISNFNNEKVQMYKEAMGNKNKENNTITANDKTINKLSNISSEQKFSQINELLQDPEKGLQFANTWKISPNSRDIEKAAKYLSYVNPRATIQDVRDFVYSDRTIDDIIYDKFNGYRDATEQFTRYIKEDTTTPELSRDYTNDYFKTEGTYDYNVGNVPMDIRRAQDKYKSFDTPYVQGGYGQRIDLGKRYNAPIKNETIEEYVGNGEDYAQSNVNSIVKSVINDYVPLKYQDAVNANQDVAKNIVVLAATADELGFKKNEIKGMIKLGLQSEKPLTIPQVIQKYSPSAYKKLAKNDMSIVNIANLVGSALFGTPHRIIDNLRGVKRYD